MSWSVQIFVDRASSLEAFAGHLTQLLRIQLEPTHDDRGLAYEYLTPDYLLRVYADHGILNDRDMNFEDYAYELSLFRLNTTDHERSQITTLDFAWFTFTQLRKTRRYPLMLVENLQTKLASFNPDETVS
jgi:hypothetical protein